MDARVSKEGYLLLKRQYSNEFRSQFCPYTLMEEEQQECGEWCPHFNIVPHKYSLKLCQNTMIDCDSIEIELEEGIWMPL